MEEYRPSLLLLLRLTRRRSGRSRSQVSGLWLKRSMPVLGEMTGIAGERWSLIKSVRFDVVAAGGGRWPWDAPRICRLTKARAPTKTGNGLTNSENQSFSTNRKAATSDVPNYFAQGSCSLQTSTSFLPLTNHLASFSIPFQPPLWTKLVKRTSS